MESDFEAALHTVMEFEITLRRVARLELMRQHGRRWLVNAPTLYSTIEPRIAVDTKAGIYDSSCSELSYLTLRELSEFIFRQSWNSIFRDVFNGKLSYLSDIQKKIAPLRNKIAHFRPVKKEDLFNARGVAEMREELRHYYKMSSLTLFHIQSDPCYTDAWIDELITAEALSALKLSKHETLWVVVAEGEFLRQFGYSLGLGIFNGHLFLEFFNEGGFPIEELDKYLSRNKEGISFISLHANKLRVFFPLANEQKETAKLVRGIHRLLGSSIALTRFSKPTTSGVLEYFVGPSLAPTFSFAL